MSRFLIPACLTSLLVPACVVPANPIPAERVVLRVQEDEASMSFFIHDVEKLSYRYGKRWAIPHIWPLRSPSGRSMLVAEPEDHPHHSSLWVVDRVQLEGGPEIDFYHEWKNLHDKEDPTAGHHSYIRHDGFVQYVGPMAYGWTTAELTWIAHGDPVLHQEWSMLIEDLGDEEYLLHLHWNLEARYGAVQFHSDWVHYAWPYLRMEPGFSGLEGGTITDDQGRTGQEATNGRYARWIDYSNTVDGVTEGLAVFLPDDGEPRKWLTREYGTFGPRRSDPFNGTDFTLAEGENLSGAVTILVHRGDVVGGKVAARYADYLASFQVTDSSE